MVLYVAIVFRQDFFLGSVPLWQNRAWEGENLNNRVGLGVEPPIMPAEGRGGARKWRGRKRGLAVVRGAAFPPPICERKTKFRKSPFLHIKRKKSNIGSIKALIAWEGLSPVIKNA